MVSSRRKKNNIKQETTNSIDQKVLEIIQNEVAYETTLRKIEKNRNDNGSRQGSRNVETE